MGITLINSVDIECAVLIHKEAFKHFFLTELGDSFLSLYYKSVSHNPNGILLGCYDDEKMLGFCAGTLLSKGFNMDIIKRSFFPFAFIGIKLLFTKPKALLRLFKNLSKAKADINDDGHYAELESIGVTPNCQGKGVGKNLLLALEEEVRRRGGQKLSLTTDYYNNEKTISFYNALGYTVWYDFVTYPNRRMYRMIKTL